MYKRPESLRYVDLTKACYSANHLDMVAVPVGESAGLQGVTHWLEIFQNVFSSADT